MAYMVGGYLIIWAASFVFIISMVQRQRRLQRELETLKEVAGQDRAGRKG
jgi:CcmD family protein